MSVSSFFSSIADKAQTAIQSTPLAQTRSREQQSGSSAGRGSYAFTESINHQLRTLKQQYGNVSPLQKTITSAKGVAIDYDNVSRDTKATSKEFYMWGQTEAEDIKDVTDRLAFFQFVHGSLAGTLSKRVDAARVPLKTLRGAESTLAVRHNVRAGYDRELAKLEVDRPRGHEKRRADLESALKKAEDEDEPLEKEVELLSRKAIRESERAKWDAIREYGEKLILLSQAATIVIDALPTLPPTENNRYAGEKTTAAARAGLQRALDNYKTGSLDLPISHSDVDLSRSDTRSFGVTHASELSSIVSATPPLHDEKGSTTSVDKSVASSPPAASPVIDPQQLNQTPAPALPARTSDLPDFVSPDPTKPEVIIPVPIPTIADTGLPQSTGPEGPGPSSGSLKDIRSPVGPDKSGQYGAGVADVASGSVHESAEDEKKRLEREERARILRHGGSDSTSQESPFESAEEEKKRLGRERERESALAEVPSEESRPEDEEEELPPYKEL